MSLFRKKLSLMGGLFLYLSSGCTDVSKLPPAERGRAAYASYQCRRCHRIGLDGGDAGPDLSFAGFRKSEEFLSLWLKDPRAWQPGTQMPDFKLNDEARAALGAYLATLKGQAYKSVPAAKNGEELFHRAGCATCHGDKGRGGVPNNNAAGNKVPDLSKVGSGFSREELIRKISMGVRHPLKSDPSGPEPYLWMPAWGEMLTPEEISMLADYLLSLYPPATGDAW